MEACLYYISARLKSVPQPEDLVELLHNEREWTLNDGAKLLHSAVLLLRCTVVNDVHAVEYIKMHSTDSCASQRNSVYLSKIAEYPTERMRYRSGTSRAYVRSNLYSVGKKNSNIQLC